MYVLIYSEGNSLSTDNECRAYDSAEKAHAVMLGQLERILADDDYSISRKVECAPGRYDLYGDWTGEGGGKVYLGFLHDFDAYLEDGEHRWVIHEVPGLFVPQKDTEQIETFMGYLKSSASTYEQREAALDVCDVIGNYV